MRNKQTILFTGGLGNQLFQYCFLLHMKYCCGIDLDYNISFYDFYQVHSGFQADKIFNFIGFDRDNKNYYNLFFYNLRRLRNHLKIKNRLIMCDDYSFDHSRRSMKFKVYEGYWQKKEYYLSIKDELAKHFIPLEQYCVDNNIADNILKTKSVFIHIRRGDYVNDSKYVDLSSTDYYKNAINWYKDKYSDVVFYVFSDDIIWAKKYFSSDEYVYMDYQNQSSLSDLYYMSICDGAIIANSSYSWWGAVLGNQKEVIFPLRYYTDETKVDLYLDKWLGI